MKISPQALPEELDAVQEIAIKQTSILDQVGVVLSAICLVHCVLTPLLLVLLPVAGAIVEDEWFHQLMLAVVLPVAGFAFFTGVRQHGNLRVAALGVTGLLLIALGTLNPESVVGETVPTILGSLCMVAAHWINRRLCQTVCGVRNPSQCCYQDT